MDKHQATQLEIVPIKPIYGVGGNVTKRAADSPGKWGGNSSEEVED